MVLTKIKCLRSFQERFAATDHAGADAARGVKSPPTEASGDAPIFPESTLIKLDKFESEDSGVELPSEANSPSSPTSSEQSFALCESLCHSEELAASQPPVDPMDESVAPYVEDDALEELESSTLTEEPIGDSTSRRGDEGGEEELAGLDRHSAATDKQSEEDVKSLEDYMDHCCRLSEVSRQTSSSH